MSESHHVILWFGSRVIPRAEDMGGLLSARRNLSTRFLLEPFKKTQGEGADLLHRACADVL